MASSHLEPADPSLRAVEAGVGVDVLAAGAVEAYL